MTVLTTNLSSSGTGNGSNTVFTFTFRVLVSTDIDVTVAGVTKTEGADYTVAIDADGVGGTVTFTSAPANGAAVVMTRNLDLTQEIGLVQEGNMPQVTLENMADKLTMICQQIAAGSGGGGGGSGTVTSFSATPSGIFDVANATTTPALSLDSQSANTHLAGPSSGAAATPSFRALVPADLATSAATGDLWYASSSTVIARRGIGSAGDVLTVSGGVPTWAAPATNGTVTSFSATPSGIFDVANATTTPALSLDNQNANLVLAGPSSGAAATPSFRSLVPLDLAASPATGDLWYASSSTVIARRAIGSTNDVLTVVGGVPTWAAPAGGGNVTGPGSATDHGIAFFDGTGGTLLKDMGGLGTSGQVLTSQGAGAMPIWAAAPGTGTVTSFSATPSGIFDVANATTTPALSLDNQNANIFLAGPSSGAAATPSFRAMVPLDLAASPATGDIWYASSSTVIARRAIGSTNDVLTVVGGVPTWAAPATNGTVTSFSATPSGIFDVANATTTPALSLDNQNANIVLAGPSSGSAATPSFRALVLLDMLLGASRSLPTSGTIASGIYYHIGNWATTATGGTFEHGVKVYCTGTWAINHTGWTVATGARGGEPNGVAAFTGNNGQGFGGGAGVVSSGGIVGGAGGANGGNGGAGSHSSGTLAGGTFAYLVDDYLGGSGGGPATFSGAGPTNSGGNGGGGLYVWAAGAITFSESISANGTAGGAGAGTAGGGAGGGSGGTFDINSLTSITVASGKTVAANGADGGVDAGTSGGGGGGGGGNQRFAAPTVTITGSQTVTAGNGGVGNGTGENGSTGVIENITTTPFPRFF